MERLSGSRPQQPTPPLQGELFGGSPGIATGPPQDPSLQLTPRLLAYSGDDTPLAKILGSTVEAASALKVRSSAPVSRSSPCCRDSPPSLGSPPAPSCSTSLAQVSPGSLRLASAHSRSSGTLPVLLRSTLSSAVLHYQGSWDGLRLPQGPRTDRWHLQGPQVQFTVSFLRASRLATKTSRVLPFGTFKIFRDTDDIFQLSFVRFHFYCVIFQVAYVMCQIQGVLFKVSFVM